MKRHFSMLLVLILILLFGLTGCGGKGLSANQKQGEYASSDSQQMDKKQTSESSIKVNEMTLEEKIGQMVIVGVKGTQVGPHAKEFIRDYHVGGVILYGNNIRNTSQTTHLINQLKTINADSGNSLPLFLSVDQEGGSISRMPEEIAALPSNKAVGNLKNPTFSHQIGQLLGKELNALSFNMDFAPVLDINSHPSNSVIGDRSFGTQKLVSKLGVATMEGIQSQNVISVVKHFPGYGDVTTDAHSRLPKVDYGMDHLKHHELIPFKDAIDQGADAIMVTHILLPKLDPHFPASMSRKIISGVLRDQLNFNGVVITDDMTMGAVSNEYQIGEAAVRSVKAGSDIVLIAHHYKDELAAFRKIKQAVKDGDISEERINDSVRRIINLKQKYDLSNRQINKVNVNQLNQNIKTVLSQKYGSERNENNE